VPITEHPGGVPSKPVDLDRAQIPGFRGWVIKDGGGQYIALDHSSGGYPYVSRDIRNIYVWNTKEAAESYRDIFTRGSTMGGLSAASSWRVVEVMLIEVPR